MKPLDAYIPKIESIPIMDDAELARNYLNTDFGRALVRYHDMDLSDVRDFVRDPGHYKDLFNLDDDDIEIANEWKASFFLKEEGKQAAYRDLEKEHPGNPLFKKEFKNIPEHFVTVYHRTDARRIDRIAKEGLSPRTEALLSDEQQEIQETMDRFVHVDKLFDKQAPEGMNRSQAVYAAVDYRTGWTDRGGVLLEIKIDPSQVMVVDGELYTEAHAQMDDSEKVAYFGRKYWDTGMSLSEFTSLPLTQQLSHFILPEVVIPHSVPESHMKILSVSQ